VLLVLLVLLGVLGVLGSMLTYVGFLFEALEGVGEEFSVAGGEVDGVVGRCHGCGLRG
jgi:hypothetical protein